MELFCDNCVSVKINALIILFNRIERKLTHIFVFGKL